MLERWDMGQEITHYMFCAYPDQILDFFVFIFLNIVKYGREQFHGLGSMYCRGASAVILTYDVTNWQSLAELEERFLSLTDTANHDCIYAIVGNKADLTDPKAQLSNDSTGVSEDHTQCEEERTEPQMLSACPTPPASPASLSGLILNKQVTHEDAVALYGRILRYKGLEDKSSLPPEKMCFETSAKTGYNVDALFETLFDLVLPSILRKRNENRESPTVDLEAGNRRSRSTCC
ncbi:ras-related protein Rab-20 isoform X2 [Paralichthys olivaceus]|uniref:ras-related protein Rab-20 isoform X2 n=1 Tax=Paralichthys olivaceus TaxID=8255 RepID=UPI003753D686